MPGSFSAEVLKSHSFELEKDVKAAVVQWFC